MRRVLLALLLWGAALLLTGAAVSADPPCGPAAIAVEGRNWFQDAFPSNETITATVYGPYDTTSAWIRTGLDLAPLTGDATRLDLPGDTVVCEAGGAGMRLDLVFRILPGVGNYVIVGNRASGMRRVPTATTAVVPNASSANFWESYLADNGALGTGGNGVSGPGHPGGIWDANRWNSTRCDTAETNLFPVQGVGNLPGLVAGRYASMVHEADPKFATLGVPKQRCFLVNHAGPINSTNITCGSGTYPPAWAAGAGLVPSEMGLAAGVTREFSQIIPDGQLTPGAHVQYFLRLSSESDPTTMLAMNPDTNVVFPQVGCVLDCARWAQFGVLPDRWKDPGFGVGGVGMACMLVVDMDDGRGDECAWVSIADSIGLTFSAQRGAHNGWGMAPPGADLNDPAYFVRSHGGQPGSYWDLYSVRGSRDTITGNAGSLGSRLAPRCAGCPATGRESRLGPTPEMLRLYRIVVLLAGGRNVAVMGPLADRGQDDVTLLTYFMVLPGGSFQPRMVWIVGSGFAESEAVGHPAFLGPMLRTQLLAGDYSTYSGNGAPSVTLTVIYPTMTLYGLRPNSLDVLAPELATPAGITAAEYDPVLPTHYGASIYKHDSVLSPYRSLVDGFDLADLGSIGSADTRGRQIYVQKALSTYVAPLGCFTSVNPGVGEAPPADLSFLALRNNPLTSGVATIRLSLARPDRARLAIYDVAGRVVRILADRAFDAGPHEISWDGSDAEGRRVASGVYLVRATIERGAGEARTLIVLR